MGASGERLIGATEACPPLFPYQVRTHLRSNRCPRVHATQHRPQPRMQRSALGRTYCMGRHDGPGDAGCKPSDDIRIGPCYASYLCQHARFMRMARGLAVTTPDCDASPATPAHTAPSPVPSRVFYPSASSFEVAPVSMDAKAGYSCSVAFCMHCRAMPFHA